MTRLRLGIAAAGLLLCLAAMPADASDPVAAGTPLPVPGEAPADGAWAASSRAGQFQSQLRSVVDRFDAQGVLSQATAADARAKLAAPLDGEALVGLLQAVAAEAAAAPPLPAPAVDLRVRIGDGGDVPVGGPCEDCMKAFDECDHCIVCYDPVPLIELPDALDALYEESCTTIWKVCEQGCENGYRACMATCTASSVQAGALGDSWDGAFLAARACQASTAGPSPAEDAGPASA